MPKKTFLFGALFGALLAVATLVTAQQQQQQQPTPDVPGAAPAPAPLQTAPSITWSGAQPGGAGIAGLWLQEKLTGTSTAPPGSTLWANQINVIDTLRTAHPSTMLDALSVQAVIRTGATGSRNAFHSHVVVEASPTGRALGSSFPAYVSGFFTAYSAHPLGGAGTTYATSGGGLWGANPNVVAATGATNLYGIVGTEVDVTAQRGSSMAQKLGLTIVQAPDSVVSGAQDDVAVNIINTKGAVGWKNGIAFGNSGAYWPISPTGTLIGGQAGQSGAGQARAAYGIDWAGIAFAAASIRVPGLVVDGGGHINMSGSTVPGHTIPTIANCGVGATIRGSDNAGTVTLGRNAAVFCEIRFGRSWRDTPHCVLSPRGTATPGVLAIIADSAAMMRVRAVSMPSFTYMCAG